MFIWLYRLLESLDGEKKYRILSYNMAQRIKVWCLFHIN